VYVDKAVSSTLVKPTSDLVVFEFLCVEFAKLEIPVPPTATATVPVVILVPFKAVRPEPSPVKPAVPVAPTALNWPAYKL